MSLYTYTHTHTHIHKVHTFTHPQNFYFSIRGTCLCKSLYNRYAMNTQMMAIIECVGNKINIRLQYLKYICPIKTVLT